MLARPVEDEHAAVLARLDVPPISLSKRMASKMLCEAPMTFWQPWKSTLFAVALVVTPTQVRGQIRIHSVAVASGFAPGLPAPGSLAAIFCTGLQGTDGVQVKVGNIAAPVLAVVGFPEYQQINFQVPWEADSSTVVVTQGAAADSFYANTPLRWTVFFTDAAGNIAALHAGGTRVVTPADPARPGEWIVAYGSNLGAVANPPANGTPTPSDHQFPLSTAQNLYYLISGASGVQASFMGLAPGLVGVYQVAMRVPDDPSLRGMDLRIERVHLCPPPQDAQCARGLWLTYSDTAHLPVGMP